MCLIAFAWRAHPRYPLVLAANRDEAHDRPSAALAAWTDLPGVLGGRDLKADGTWLGLRADGRMAAVTNVREPAARDAGLASRGALARDFLAGHATAAAQGAALMAAANGFGPFNLLLADGEQLIYASNRPTPHWQAIAPGVHGLSNARLDTPWPKTLRLTAALAQWIADDTLAVEPLFVALADETSAADDALPDTGVGLALERLLSPPFIRGSSYGTRASTVLCWSPTGGFVEERRFGPRGAALGAQRLDF